MVSRSEPEAVIFLDWVKVGVEWSGVDCKP
jgi:hypothetical protein